MRFRKSFWGFSLMWQCNTIYNYIFNQWFLCNYLALVSIFSNFFEVHVFNCLSLFSWTCQDNKKRITVHEDTPPGLLSDEEEPDGAIGWVSHFYSRDLTSGPMRVSGLLLIIDYILAIESRQQLFKFCPVIIKNLWPVRLNLKLSLMNTWSLHIKWRIQILWIWVFFLTEMTWLRSKCLLWKATGKLRSQIPRLAGGFWFCRELVTAWAWSLRSTSLSGPGKQKLSYELQNAGLLTTMWTCGLWDIGILSPCLVLYWVSFSLIVRPVSIFVFTIGSGRLYIYIDIFSDKFVKKMMKKEPLFIPHTNPLPDFQPFWPWTGTRWSRGQIWPEQTAGVSPAGGDLLHDYLPLGTRLLLHHDSQPADLSKPSLTALPLHGVPLGHAVRPPPVQDLLDHRHHLHRG